MPKKAVPWLIGVVAFILLAAVVVAFIMMYPAVASVVLKQSVLVPSGMVVALVVFYLWSPPRHYLFAYDADHVAYGDKDGYGPFTALASFALAQGAALTAVAKGEDRTGLVLFIYAVAVTLTVLWIRSMLAAVKEQPAVEGQVVADTPLRAYDRPSITYGRWAQSFASREFEAGD